MIALIAGADGFVATRLAVGMLGLQFAIGTANDVADESRDRLSRPRKPIVAGMVEPRQARAAFVVAAGVGLVAAASVGAAPLAVGIVGLGVGLIYDLRLKGTALSWLPFAVGVALLPVYAWIGATGSLPTAFWGIVAMALLAGAVLAVANAVADIERDRQAGAASVATILGRDRAIAVEAVGLVLLQTTVEVSSVAAGLSGAALPVELAGITLSWLGLRLSAGHDEQVARLGWEVQAVAMVVMGAAWLAALGSAGRL